NATGTGSTSSIFTPPSSVAGTTYYRVLVNASNSGCDQAVSNNAIAIIAPDIVITIQPTNVNECVGGTDQMTVSITGGSGTILYQWQSSPDGVGSWANATGTGSTSSIFTPPSSVAGTTYYRVLVNASNSGCDQAISNTATAIISPDLTVTTQPSNVNECGGGTNTMTVIVSGGSGTVTYQWQQSANAGGPFVNSTGTGAATATYTPDSSVPGTTYYRVLVNASNNGCDQAVSNTATAIISPDLTVTTQPTNVNECVGGTNTMTVVVSGGSGAITYQWQQSANAGGPFVNSTGTGATTATYTPDSSVPGTTYYRVLINASNNGCDQAISNTSTAVITPDLSITTQPVSLNECIGGNAQLTVVVAGGSGTISYQWQQSPDGTNNWINAIGGSGSTSANYTPPSTSAGTTYYRVIVSAAGNGCDPVTSSVVSVEIDPSATISVAPILTEVCVGAVSSLTATVTGGSNTLVVQWQLLTGSWNDIPGATGLTYNPPTTTSGTFQYRARVVETANGCATPFSNIVTFIVRDNATVTISDPNPEVCVGGTSIITAVVTGGSSGMVMQWQSSPDNSVWSNIPGANSTTYSAPTTVAGTTYYRMVITDNQPNCSDPVSNVVTIIVQPDATVSLAPITSEICIGGTSLLTATITGGSSNLTIQWQSNTNGGGWQVVSGATGNTYLAPGTVTGSVLYRVQITDNFSDCSDPLSNTVTVVIRADATVSVAPVSSEVCIGGTAVLTATITGGSLSLTQQWQSSPDGTTGWANIPGATNTTYSAPTTVAGTTYYRIVVTDPSSDCADPISNVVSVLVQPDATVSIAPLLSNVCVGGSVTLTATVTGGSSVLTMQWQSSPTGAVWTNIGGATGTTYNPPTGSAGSNLYRIVITDNNSDCSDPVSSNAQVVVAPDISVTTQPTNISECIGGNNTMTVVITGGSGTITYQWQSSPDGTTNWSNATGTGATTATYTPESTIAGTTYYRVLINASNSGCDQAVSANATATITPDVSITTQPSNITECVGGSNTMTVAITGGSGSITYQWQQSADGIGGWSNGTGAGATSATYTPVSTTAGTTYYRVLVNASGSGCDQAVSNNATAVIIPDLVVTTQPSNIAECIGGTSTMTVVTTGGIGTISYQWQQSASSGGPWSNATGIGATTSVYTPISTSSGTTFYRVIISASGSGCDAVTSGSATAIISPDLAVTTQPSSITECIGGSATMTVVVTGGSGTITYQWQQSADGSTGWANGAGSGATTATYTPVSTSAGVTFYRVLIN
ncbi:MAG TPA: hypothetical protein VJ508_16765, partial [Saprospiraceae bacterium]|nr:hypothetical protein [Saprospiraceae bacterium]